ncbi:6598_t:CDS:2 [Dentiscutata heterogama]|uniref:6598_t:CDS:1 n=1 Tax=Dentiscutata heterogama TaxID=1316150 RepID=A0ACA9MKR8_9GLOM|nr:6598_t:CDS:2 [Dentiscutata heterogama]
MSKDGTFSISKSQQAGRHIFKLVNMNNETKECEAIFWFDKMEMFFVNHSSEIVGINRNEHLELYSRINDSIQKKIIDIETQELQKKKM